MATKRPGAGVQSVQRVFELLEVITDTGGAVTLSELSSTTDLPLPTIHRLLGTLVALGYVRQLQNRRYVLGPRLIRLGAAANSQLGSVARSHLEKLVHQLGESANMAVLDSDSVIYIAQVPSFHSMRMFTEVGHRAHLHATGVGKAILAELSEERVKEIVNRTGLATPTERSIGNLDQLLSEIRITKERGYSIDDGEQEVGVRCYAIAIPGAQTPTAISVSGPVSRIDEQFERRAVPLLREAAISISEELGFKRT